MSAIRVAIVDDHPVVLSGIRALLQTEADIQIVGEASNGAAALRMIMDASPDVAVVDISLPDMSGLELAARLAAERPNVNVLAMTVHEDRSYVKQLLQAGARGYLLKRSAAEELIRAVHAVADGGIYLDPLIAEHALPLPDDEAPGEGPEAAALLSERERDTIRLLAQGLSNKEVAARLEVAVKTVETYKARAVEKLGLRTRAEILRFAAAQDWLEGQ